MRMFLTAICTATLLAACGPDREGTFETDDGGEGSYSFEEDGESGTIQFTDGEGGEVSIDIGEDAEAALPDGFSVYPGAKVATTATMGGTRESGSMLALESPASPANIVAHYRREAEAAGYEIEMEGRAGDSYTVNATKGGETMMVQSSAEGSGSNTMLMFQRDE